MNKKEQVQDEKKKIVSLKATNEGEDYALDKYKLALTIRIVIRNYRRSKNQITQKEKQITTYNKNEEKCYNCKKYGHIAYDF